jgi:hypothetical protein
VLLLSTCFVFNMSTACAADSRHSSFNKAIAAGDNELDFVTQQQPFD